MNHYLVKLGKKPSTVCFRIEAKGELVPVYIVGYDPFTPNSFYFKSRFLITGEEEIRLNCPQAPGRLKIQIWSDDEQSVNVKEIHAEPFERPQGIDDIINFVERFAKRAGVLRPGKYYADNVPFTIEYVRAIYNSDGSVHPTPARISVDKPLIQVSKAKFDYMSIPERVIILLHEVSHNFINYDMDDELESDMNGLKIYEWLGYPKIEAMNAFAEIMSDTDINYERMLNLINR